MSNQKQMLVSDLDGTLLFRKGKEHFFLPEDVKALQEFRKRGNLVAVNSGRCSRWLMEPLAGNVEWDYLICNSGSVIVNHEEKMIYEQTISPEILEELLVLNTEKWNITINTRQEDYTLYPAHYDTSFLKEIPFTDRKQIRDLFSEEKIHGISIHFKTREEAAFFMEKLYAGFGRTQEKCSFFQNETDIDMAAPHCSKGNAILILQKLTGISNRQIYAIGDSYNDIPMLQQAGHSATFYGAPEQVKKQAEYLVHGISELLDGIH